MFHVGQHLTIYPENYFPEDNDEFRSLQGHAVEVLSGPHEIISQRVPTPAYIVRLSTTSALHKGDLIVAYEHELHTTPKSFDELQRLNCRYVDFHIGRSALVPFNGEHTRGTIVTAMRKHACDPVYGIQLASGGYTISHGSSFL